MSTIGAPTPKTQLKRVPERGQYDRESLDAVLDEGYLCHVGIVHDDQPVVIPTLYTRMGDHLILHGSPASRLLRSAKNNQICVTVTHVDGFVLARSALHHSMNYRSAVIFGKPEVVETEHKAAALDALTDSLAPDRRPFLREMTEQEVKGTLLLRLSLDEASVKIRQGGPVDEPEDYELPIWAGVIPVTVAYGEPITDPLTTTPAEIPNHAKDFRPPS